MNKTIPNYLIEIEQSQHIPFESYEHAYNCLLDIWNRGDVFCRLLRKDNKSRLQPVMTLIPGDNYLEQIRMFRTQWPTRNAKRYHSNLAQRQWLKHCIKTIRQYRELGGKQ